MKASSPWLPVGLWLGSLLVAGYTLMVSGTVRLRMDKVSQRAEQLAEVEAGMQEYRAAQSGLADLPDTALPDLQASVQTELPGERVTLNEGAPLTVSADWVQRRTQVKIDNCALPALQAWLLTLQTPEAGWRLLSCELRSESSAGRASGVLELAGMERRSSGGRP